MGLVISMNDDFALYLNDLIPRRSKFTEMWFKCISEEFTNDNIPTVKEIVKSLSGYLSVETDKNLHNNAHMKASRSNIDDDHNELEQAWESSILNGIK